jgi:hypothetical protein
MLLTSILIRNSYSRVHIYMLVSLPTYLATTSPRLLHFNTWQDDKLCRGAWCNRTDQIIRAQVQKQVPETLKFSNLSPYNPGSQSKPRRISNQLAYNQDRIIQHNTSHVTFHKYLIKSFQHHEVAIITNQVYKVAKA